MRGPRLALCLSLAAATAAVPASAESSVAGKPASTAPRAVRTYTLKECLRLADRNYPKIHEARAREKRKQARLFEVQTAPYSEHKLDAGIALAPTLRGNSIYSPNTQVALNSNISLAWQFAFSGVIPIWTFGKIGAAWRAAEADVGVSKAAVQVARKKARFDVRRAYYGALLAQDSLYLLKEAEGALHKQLGHLQELVDDGKGDDIELLKMKMYAQDIVARRSQAERSRREAIAGLRFFTGVRGPLNVVDEPLQPVKHELGPLTRYLTAARLHRPEVNMARAGIVARRAQVELERARYYPDVGLGVSAGWRRAPQIADQTNPFISDPNVFSYGAGLVLRWKLDLLPRSARVAQAEAQLEEMEATERYALGGVAVEVERAHAEATDARTQLEAHTKAASYARRWLVKVKQGIDVGTFDDGDIVDPLKEYSLRRYARMQAIMNFNVAIARLALATGWTDVLNAP